MNMNELQDSNEGECATIWKRFVNPLISLCALTHPHLFSKDNKNMAMILSETQDKNARLISTVTMLRQNLDECRTERKWQECLFQVKLEFLLHWWLLWTTMNYYELLWTTMNYYELPWTIIDSTMNYHKLLLTLNVFKTIWFWCSFSPSCCRCLCKTLVTIQVLASVRNCPN